MQTLKLTYGDTNILIWEMTEAEDEFIQLLNNFDEYKTEFSSISTQKRKKEFLCLRFLANQLAGKPVKIIYDNENKPHIHNSDHQISFSHSGKWAAAILHPYQPVGIDLECPSDKIAKVTPRFTNEAERVFLYPKENDKAKLLIWCAKETLFKIEGKTLTDFAASMQVLPFVAADNGTLKLLTLADRNIYHISYLMNDDFALTWCIKNDLKEAKKP